MKLFSKNPPPDPLDDLFAAALLGELTPEERAELELRLQTDPAAHAAYQETLHMHDLLEKNYREAQPDPAFEQRMVSGVRRKIRHEEQHGETAWESVGVLWNGMKRIFVGRRWIEYAVICGAIVLVAGVAFGPITSGLKKANGSPQTLDAEDFTVEKAAEKAPVPSAPPAVLAAIPAAPQAQSRARSASNIEDSNSDADSFALRVDNLRNRLASTKGVESQGLAGLRSRLDAPAVAFAVPAPAMSTPSTPASPAAPSSEPSRKLVRNAQLDLEVKSFQATVDEITSRVNAGGGYVESSNSQRGGNGKLQGTIVVKLLPQNLDAFLLKLRELGEIKNQSVSTDDVTKAYYDTQARLDNARRMEAQLQILLQRDNGKVAELLQVERELGRVRGEIEQMQGELKLYDFQVQYATVTISVQEKDLNQAAAFLLRERDEFSLFAPDVEAAFQQARQAADDFKAHVLNADLEHNSGSAISATLVASVPPEQIDGFITRVKTLGRIDTFTRQTERVANDGGQSDQPADETKTEKDRVVVHLTIRSDDETPRQQTQVSIVATDDIDGKARQLKEKAAAESVAVTASSFERETDGTETAGMTFRLPMAKVSAFMEELKKLGRIESLTVHRNDQPGAISADDNAPAEIALTLHTQAALIADDSGLWATLRRTFGEGIAAFLGSVRTIGVIAAFVLPWVFALGLVAWIARRIYVMRRK